MRIQDKGSTQRAYTKDGYLVVPATLSRVGIFDYLNSEVGRAGNGTAKVARTEKSLFGDETIKSFENVPITLGHPAEEVNAKNWKQLAVGTMRNVKRDGDFLTGEAWINDENAIRIVQQNGIDELSCGYSCELIDSTQAGADLEMSPMVGNHIAIVADGRCGRSCKLADQQKGKPKMSEKRKLLDSLLGVFGITLTDEQAKKVDEEKADEKETEKSDEKKTDTKTEKSSDEKADKSEKTKDDEDEKSQKVKDSAAIADLQKQLDEAKAEIKRLTDANAATLRTEQEQAVVSAGIFAKDDVAKLSDAELAGAYKAAQVVTKKLNDRALGGVLLQDNNTQSAGFDFNSYSKGEA